MVTRVKEKPWFIYKVQLKSLKTKRAKERLYEHGNEFWLVQVKEEDIHVYSLDKKWYGWFKLGVEVKPYSFLDEMLISMMRKEGD